MKLIINGYTVTEHLELRRSNKEIFELDRAIGNLKRNKKKYMQVVVILAYIMLVNPELAFATDKVVELGYGIIKNIQIYAGIVATVMAVVEIAGELVKGGRNHLQIIFKYSVGYIALLLVPTVFETIKGLF